MRRRLSLQPGLETLESLALLSSLPLHPDLSAVAHAAAASTWLISLMRSPLTGSTIMGTLKGKTEATGKKYELSITVGHFHEVGTTERNSIRPVSGSLEYTVSKKSKDTFEFKSAQIVILNLGRAGGEISLRLTVPKAEKAENAKDVTEFVYSVTKATGSYKGTKAQGDKLIKFAQLWPPTLDSSDSYSGTFS
jgi:hypothetical protein